MLLCFQSAFPRYQICFNGTALSFCSSNQNPYNFWTANVKIIRTILYICFCHKKQFIKISRGLDRASNYQFSIFVTQNLQLKEDIFFSKFCNVMAGPYPDYILGAKFGTIPNEKSLNFPSIFIAIKFVNYDKNHLISEFHWTNFFAYTLNNSIHNELLY